MKRPFGRGTALLGGRKLSMVINHLLTGMILQAWLFGWVKRCEGSQDLICLILFFVGGYG